MRVQAGEEFDSPWHCENGAACLEALDLEEYGLKPGDTLYGMETARIGALVTESLTPDGAEWLRETLREPERTPYQRALYRFWRAAFADCLD